MDRRCATVLHRCIQRILTFVDCCRGETDKPHFDMPLLLNSMVVTRDPVSLLKPKFKVRHETRLWRFKRYLGSVPDYELKIFLYYHMRK